MTGRDAALHMAAMRGRREACAMLVKRGADPTLTDDSGRVAADMTDDAVHNRDAFVNSLDQEEVTLLAICFG